MKIKSVFELSSIKKLSYSVVFIILLLPAEVKATLYEVEWIDQVNVYYNPSTKTLSNTGTSNWGTSGAASSNTIASGNGQLYYEIANQTEVQVGLSSVNYDPGPNSIQFSFRLEYGTIFIMESGNIVGTFGAVNVGTRLEIERLGTDILYKINSSIVYGTNYSSSAPLITDVALKNGSSVIGLVKMSVDVPSPPPVPIEALFHPVKSKLDGGYYTISNNKLRVLFTDKYVINNSYTFKIYKSSPNTTVKTNSNYSGLSKKLGDNFLELSVSSLTTGIYTFEIIDDKGKKMYLRFKK